MKGLLTPALLIAALLAILAVSPALAEELQETSQGHFALLDQLLGRWVGSGSGQWGESQVEKEYKKVLGGAFIAVEGTSIYAPQGDHPAEKHEELGIYSFDSLREQAVFRQFHIEGFVNHYVLEETSADGRSLVFVTESIENIPEGWRARETLTMQSDGTLIETFELAEPGGKFELYSSSQLTRVAYPELVSPE